MSVLFSYLKRHKPLLALALALAAINQTFSLLDPQIFRIVVDRYAAQPEAWDAAGFARGIALLLAGIVGVAFISRVAKSFQDYYVSVIAQRVGAALYADGVAHAFSLPYAVFEDERSGSVLATLQKARQDAQTLIANGVNVVFLSALTILLVIGYAFVVHWQIGIIYTLLIPIMTTTTLLVSRRIKAIQKTIVAETASLAGSTTETLRNVELVKSLGLEAQETDRLNAVNEKILALELRKVRMVRGLSFLQGTLINAMRSGLMGIMLWLIFQGDITIGQFFSLLFYSFYVFGPLTEFGSVAAQYQEAKGSMEELRKILSREPEVRASYPKSSGPLREIAFQDAAFSYTSANVPALQSVNVTVRQGQTIAFVGPSGSGKSTLVKLLVGLYHPAKGTMVVNGIPSSDLDRDDFRRRIGYVSQETQLFAGTIRENLRFVRPDASDDACRAALQAASSLGITERNGDGNSRGLDTRIGEGGLKLSGGERQRLAIARALLRDPELIIFDEATSSLDSITERSITDTIKAITVERPALMTVLVAHRLSTVAHADEIHVLERGSIVEHGTHATLIAAGGLYAALWREQQAAG